MIFSFIRKSKISSVFAASKVHFTHVLEVCDFFYKLGAFFTSRGQMKEHILKRSATAIYVEFTSWQ